MDNLASRGIQGIEVSIAYRNFDASDFLLKGRTSKRAFVF
jgi:hypothetical protein